MTDEGDEGARVGLWVALGVVALLLFGLIGGLAFRQMHKKAVPVAVAPMTAPSPSAGLTMPAVAAVEALMEGPLSGDLLSKLYFDLGSAALPAEAAAAVTAAKSALAGAAPAAKLVLSGFHDASGDPLKNAELAKQRAKAVREALSSSGVELSRIAMRKPEITTGGGDANEARRVEIRLVP
jgi:outer membrane protein OmpA-like peptidoglycan-associated protein